MRPCVPSANKWMSTSPRRWREGSSGGDEDIRAAAVYPDEGRFDSGRAKALLFFSYVETIEEIRRPARDDGARARVRGRHRRWLRRPRCREDEPARDEGARIVRRRALRRSVADVREALRRDVAPRLPAHHRALPPEDA